MPGILDPIIFPIAAALQIIISLLPFIIIYILCKNKRLRFIVIIAIVSLCFSIYYLIDLNINRLSVDSIESTFTEIPAKFLISDLSDTLFIDIGKRDKLATDNYIVKIVKRFPTKRVISFNYDRNDYFNYELGHLDAFGHCSSDAGIGTVDGTPNGQNYACAYAISRTVIPSDYTGIVSVDSNWTNDDRRVSFEKLNIKLPTSRSKTIRIIYNASGNTITILARYASLRFIPGNIILPPMIGCFTSDGIFPGFYGCGFRRRSYDFIQRGADNYTGEHVLHGILGFDI